MIGYKGFNSNWTCLEKSYQIGKTYYENKIKKCLKGMHFCHFPFDVFNFYIINDVYHKEDIPKYAMVESLDGKPEKEFKHAKKILSYEFSKFVTGKLKIIKELSISDIIDETVKFILNNTEDLKKYFNICKSGMIKKNDNDKRNFAISRVNGSIVFNEKDNGISISPSKMSYAVTSGERSMSVSNYVSIASGNRSISVSKNNYSFSGTAITTGNKSICITDRGTTITTGERNISVNNSETLYYNRTSISFGNNSILTSVSDNHKMISHGDSCVLVNNSIGSKSILESDGKYSILVGYSEYCIFKGAIGCMFVAPKFEFDKTTLNNKIIGFNTKIVDGKDIEPDMYYQYDHYINKFVKLKNQNINSNIR